MLKNVTKIVWFILAVSVMGLRGVVAPAVEANSSGLSALMEDFKTYITTNTDFHAGNLYEHSLWVTIAINEWFACHNEWTNGLTGRDREIALIAGLLHDIGKAGDAIHTFYTKPLHMQKGQYYVLGQEPYQLSTGKVFDFNKLFDQLRLSVQERQEIAIIIASHHEFGGLVRKSNGGLVIGEVDRIGFTDTIQKYASLAQYAHPIDTRLLNLIILVSAADVRGSQYVACEHPFSIGDVVVNTSPSVVYRVATDKFKEFTYELRGKPIRNLLLQCVEHESVWLAAAHLLCDYAPSLMAHVPSICSDACSTALIAAAGICCVP